MPFTALSPNDLDGWVDDERVLVIDIRNYAAYSSARILRAISVSVPSTLLRRPLFSLQRLSTMLPSLPTREAFSAWPNASRILVYDVDSTSLNDSSNITGLLRKFLSDGFQHDLAWIKGGFQAVSQEQPHLLDFHPPSYDLDADEHEDYEKHAGPGPHQSVLIARRLPKDAFSHSLTATRSPQSNFVRSSQIDFNIPYSTSKSLNVNPSPAFNPFFDTVRQNTELSQGITERIPLRLPRRVRRRIHDLPFPWLQDIACRASKGPPRHKSAENSCSSESGEDSSTNPAIIRDGADALAMQFFKIELSEQRRLMGVLQRHSRESGHVFENAPSTVNQFPFSITAGVEKGTKNRYRHIWPFEHARVRLHQRKEADDDYVNASYIQPLGTNKRYIATQGPLPTTFKDFWTLCWEQNVHVIVMLTREFEGAMEKCGVYWSESVFGPLRLQLLSTEGLDSPDERPSTAGLISQHPVLSVPSYSRMPHSAGSKRYYRHRHYHNKTSETIKRIFELSHSDYPAAKPRRIIHLQYLEWPDMNVPEDPRGVLGLVKQVEEAVALTRFRNERDNLEARKVITSQNSIDEMTGVALHALCGNNPVLLHCSAGVGRTGGFIAVDAVLDAVRRELQAINHRKPDAKQFNGDDPGLAAAISLPTSCVESSPRITSVAESVNWSDDLQHTANMNITDSLSILPKVLSSEQNSVPLPISSNETVVSCERVSSLSLNSHQEVPLSNYKHAAWPRQASSNTTSISRNCNLSLSSVPASEATHIQNPSTPVKIRSDTQEVSLEEKEKKNDYKEPRPLHEISVPPPLTSFTDPIWEIVQDMREQRMSLCQSLRQYVFVHAAIIEGALMIVDEEKEIDLPQVPSLIGHSSAILVSPPATESQVLGLSMELEAQTNLASILSPSNAKRSPSPTELLKESKEGEVMLSKRPSVKRKQRTVDRLLKDTNYIPVQISGVNAHEQFRHR